MEVQEAHPFRVTRDADMVIQEVEAADLLEMMEQTVRQRRFGSVVLISINDSMPARIREILMENLEVDRNEMYTIDGPMGYSELSLHNIDRYDIKDRLRHISPGHFRKMRMGIFLIQFVTRIFSFITLTIHLHRL
jgi:polyphosphate kinase